jgi:hypothetical protein
MMTVPNRWLGHAQTPWGPWLGGSVADVRWPFAKGEGDGRALT